MRLASHRTFWLVSFIVVTVLVIALFATRGPLQAQPAPTIRIGYLPIAASAPLFVAIQDDLFRQNQITVELIEFRSSNELAIAGTSGSVDVMVTCATNAALDAMATTGSRVQIFQTNGYRGEGEGKPTDFLLGRPEVTLQDLRGKPVAFFPGSVSRVFASIVLPQFGLSIDDIQYIEMSPGEWLPALQGGRIQAVVAVEPFATMIVQSGHGKVLIAGYVSRVLPSAPLSGSWFAGDTLTVEQQKRIADVFATAVEKIESSPEDAAKAISAFTGIDSSIASQIGLNKWMPASEPAASESLMLLVDILDKHGALKDRPKSDDWIWPR